LIQYTHLMQLSPALRTKILKDLSGATEADKLEAFANRMAQLAADKALLETGEVSKQLAEGDPYGGLFVRIIEDLKRAWEELKSVFKPPGSFTSFVDGLLSHARVQRGVQFKGRSILNTKGAQRKDLRTPLAIEVFNALQALENGGAYIPRMDTDITIANMENAAQRAEDPIFKSYVEDIQNWANRTKQDPVGALASLVRSADSELRSMGLHQIADYFHVRPVSTGNSLTVFRNVQQLMAPWERKLTTILDAIPGSRLSLWEMVFNKQPTAEQQTARETNKRITEALLLKTPLSELSAEDAVHVKAVREYFQDMHRWAVEVQGLNLGKVADYYPMMLDTLKLDKNREQFEQRLSEANFTNEEVQETRVRILRDEDGGLVNGFQRAEEVNDFFGPGLASNLHRAKGKWTDRLRATLVADGFYQDDMATTMIAYTHMLVRRAAWQNRFKETDFSSSKLMEYTNAGINAHSPIASLLLEVHNADINEWQRQRVLKDILPAYAGQLGLRTNSQLRKIGATVVIYQNLRLLAFAIFSQFVDVGTLFTRGGWADSQAAMKGLMDKTTREQALIMLQEIGALRIGLTEHVLNDQALNTFLTGKAKRINDLFFRYNGMEGWTNLMRTMGLLSGRSFIKRHGRLASEGDATSQRYLDELGITVGEATAWDGNSTADARINAALNRYIDESMIRPDATIRPVWMSDPGYGIFAHLKGFMFGFHETFLRRVGREAQIHQNLLPLLMLGMMALPFAAVGYELRRKIVGGGERPEGFAYIKELVERSGMPGAFQLVVDMEQADEFGKPFGLGIGGPAVEQLYDFFSKDFDAFYPKAIPIVAASPTLRQWVKDNG